MSSQATGAASWSMPRETEGPTRALAAEKSDAVT